MSEFQTTGVQIYTFFPTDKTRFNFDVRAGRDAYLVLTPENYEGKEEIPFPNYKIVIGGYANKRLCIKKNDKYVNEKWIPYILSKEEYRRFWVRWDNKTLTLWRKDIDKPLLEYKDSDMFDIKYMGFCTNHNNPGSWRIDTFETTGDQIYKFFPTSGERFDFNVRAARDAYIALSPVNYNGKENFPWPNYKIVIGGYANKRLCINKNDEYVDDVIISNILSKDEYRKFWVQWDNKTVTLWQDGKDKPLLKYKDPKMFAVKYIGFCTNHGNAGTWRLDSTF